MFIGSVKLSEKTESAQKKCGGYEGFVADKKMYEKCVRNAEATIKLNRLQETDCAKYVNSPDRNPVAQPVTVTGKVRLNRMIKGSEGDAYLARIRYVVELNPATLNRNKAFRSCGIRAVTIDNNTAGLTDAMLGRTVSITGVLHDAEVSAEEIDNATMLPDSVRVLD